MARQHIFLVLIAISAACGARQNAEPLPRPTVWPEDALAALPIDTRAVVSVDVEMALQSQAFSSLLQDSVNFSIPESERIERECGLQPEKLVRRVMIGAFDIHDQSSMFIVAHLSVTRALLESCWSKLGYAAILVGPTVRYQAPAGSLSVYWAKDDLIVTTATRTIDPAQLAKDRGVTRPELYGALRRVNQTGIVWVAASGLGEKNQRNEPWVPDTWFVSLSGIADLTVTATGLFENPEQAAKIDSDIGTKLMIAGLMSAPLRKLRLNRRGRELTLSATFTPGELEEMKSSVQMLLGQSTKRDMR